MAVLPAPGGPNTPEPGRKAGPVPPAHPPRRALPRRLVTGMGRTGGRRRGGRSGNASRREARVPGPRRRWGEVLTRDRVVAREAAAGQQEPADDKARPPARLRRRRDQLDKRALLAGVFRDPC